MNELTWFGWLLFIDITLTILKGAYKAFNGKSDVRSPGEMGVIAGLSVAYLVLLFTVGVTK